MPFLEEMVSNAELLDCAVCGEETLPTHEVVLSIAGNITELKMLSTTSWNAASGYSRRNVAA